MKFLPKPLIRALGLVCVLCISAVSGLALDREAFSIPSYELNLQIDPSQHRLGVRGRITLRNDSSTPQKIAVLQISSSLDWRSITSGDKPVQFVTQPYTSDIDHTGALSEAIVTLPEAVPPHQTAELQVAYEGVIALDATRLTRIGMPEEIARSTDWDAIDPAFSAVRGAGYVAWYPISTEVANLSEDNSLFETLARWRSREAGARAHIRIEVITGDGEQKMRVLLDQVGCSTFSAEGSAQPDNLDCTLEALGSVTPTFVIAPYGIVECPSVTVFNLPAHATAGEIYAEAAEEVMPLVSDWFGGMRHKAQFADLPDANGASFENGSFLLAPLSGNEFTSGLSAAHQLTHASFSSFRLWIQEGLAHFAQALYVEQQKGGQAAVDYMSAHRSTLIGMEQSTTGSEADRSLVHATDDEFYRSKAMSVWWMLRDMVGGSALKKAIAAYRPEQDKEPSYMPRLIAAQTQRDLEWFFDDWVYRDRGLPDFKVESAYSRKTMTNAYMLTITVDNLGSAGAEVPILVKFNGGDARKRLEVRGKSKATIRIEMPAVPEEITINDGSVPESDTANNTFKLTEPAK